MDVLPTAPSYIHHATGTRETHQIYHIIIHYGSTRWSWSFSVHDGHTHVRCSARPRLTSCGVNPCSSRATRRSTVPITPSHCPTHHHACTTRNYASFPYYQPFERRIMCSIHRYPQLCLSLSLSVSAMHLPPVIDARAPHSSHAKVLHPFGPAPAGVHMLDHFQAFYLC